jgi:hypothetical protein
MEKSGSFPRNGTVLGAASDQRYGQRTVQSTMNLKIICAFTTACCAARSASGAGRIP